MKLVFQIAGGILIAAGVLWALPDLIAGAHMLAWAIAAVLIVFVRSVVGALVSPEFWVFVAAIGLFIGAAYLHSFLVAREWISRGGPPSERRDKIVGLIILGIPVLIAGVPLILIAILALMNMLKLV